MIRLAQLGLPVPAEGMALTPLFLHVHMPGADDPTSSQGWAKTSGRSLQENLAAAEADPFSLTIMDEIMPGTEAEGRSRWTTSAFPTKSSTRFYVPPEADPTGRTE